MYCVSRIHFPGCLGGRQGRAGRRVPGGLLPRRRRVVIAGPAAATLRAGVPRGESLRAHLARAALLPGALRGERRGRPRLHFKLYTGKFSAFQTLTFPCIQRLFFCGAGVHGVAAVGAQPSPARPHGRGAGVPAAHAPRAAARREHDRDGRLLSPRAALYRGENLCPMAFREVQIGLIKNVGLLMFGTMTILCILAHSILTAWRSCPPSWTCSSTSRRRDRPSSSSKSSPTAGPCTTS